MEGRRMDKPLNYYADDASARGSRNKRTAGGFVCEKPTQRVGV